MNSSIRSSALAFAVVLACVLANILNGVSATRSSDLGRDLRNEQILQMYYDDEATKYDSPSLRNVKRSVHAKDVGLDGEVGLYAGLGNPAENIRGPKRETRGIRIRTACPSGYTWLGGACRRMMIN